MPKEIQKTVKIKVTNPVMAYCTLRNYDIECTRNAWHIIISEADYQLADSLLEEYKK